MYYKYGILFFIHWHPLLSGQIFLHLFKNIIKSLDVALLIQ